MLTVRISSNGARGKFREHDKDALERNSSFLSALQTSQMHGSINRYMRTAKTMSKFFITY